MKPSDLNSFNTLSNLVGKGTSLVVQSTRMDFETNTYISELWKRSNGQWKSFKSGNNNFSNPKFGEKENIVFYVKTNRTVQDKSTSKKTLSIIHMQEGRSIDTIFEIEGGISNYSLSKDGKSMYVITSEWSEEFKNIEDKNSEPMYYENLPFRFDTRGIIYNKRAHVYKVNIQTKKFTKIIDGDAKDIISIESLVEGEKGLVLSFDQYNSKGTMLEEKIGAIVGSKIKEIYSKGSMGNLFYYEDELHAVGLRNRFEWPTNTTILKFTKSGKQMYFKYRLFDRNIVKAEVNEDTLYFLYEDSGKTLLRDGTNNIDLINSEITIKDFAFNNEKTYVIANSFSNPDEVYELNSGQLTKISKANEFFTKKVKTWDCQYKRIDTGKSEIDTWGIFVGKDKPTILNIHGGPASQYAFTFFDEFQTYASAGFNVIACNPRGSSGRGHDFLRDVCGNKWGVTDMHDVLTSFKSMKKIMGITNKNDGIMGGSYGGFMTSWIISHHPNMFKSAIVERALLNWETMVGTSDIGIGFPEMYLLDDMDKNINLYRKKSPITYASNIKTPTLILHSQEDYRCPIEQAEQLFSNLKRRGVKTAMLRFPGESHELSRSGTPNHRKQRFDHVIKWHKDNLN
jgi:dipeptidyl aminopeptidase/acylaminoacyl peptidase